MKSIAEQDAAIPRCNVACTTCYGFKGRESNHHWMLDFPYPEEQDQSDPPVRLICRHCPAVIAEFDIDDPDCPEV